MGRRLDRLPVIFRQDHAPLWGLVGIVTDPLADNFGSESLIQSMSVDKSLVAPYLDGFTGCGLDLIHDRGCNAGSPSLWMNIHANNLGGGPRYTLVVVNYDEFSLLARNLCKEANAAAANYSSIKLGDPESGSLEIAVRS